MHFKQKDFHLREKYLFSFIWIRRFSVFLIFWYKIHDYRHYEAHASCTDSRHDFQFTSYKWNGIETYIT